MLRGTASTTAASPFGTPVITPAGTTGTQVINARAGTVNFAAGAVSLVVTNNLVTTNSIILTTIRTNDAAVDGIKVVAANGSFTIFLTTGPAAEMSVGFSVV